ncbi:MAG: oxidoreductase [Deltaproteobacteria bacterium]|nr:oxidoreductase [Deltaproteobacteria bacterium]
MSDKPLPPPPPGLASMPPLPRPPPPMGSVPPPPPGLPPPPLAQGALPPLPPGLPPPPGFSSSPAVAPPPSMPAAMSPSMPPAMPAAMPPSMPPLVTVPAAPSAQPSPREPSAPPPQAPVRKLDAVVVDCVRRTRTVTSLYLFVGDPGPYRAGQFLSIDAHQFPELAHWLSFLEEKKGKVELPRAYSMQSAPGEKCVSICVEAEDYDPRRGAYPPLLSPFLAYSALKGREIEVTGFAGSYVIPDDIEQATDQVLHLVGGAGVVPSYSILKDELKNAKHARVRHTVITVNRRAADAVLREQLEALAQAYPDRLQLVPLLTDEDAAGALRGQLTLELVRKHVPAPATVRAYVSGASITRHDRQAAREQGVEAAPRFLESASALLDELGVPREHVKREAFG